MPELLLPCPLCQSTLIVDEDNAGQEVLCPQCHAHLCLPSDLSGNTPVKPKTTHAIPASPHVEPHKVESAKNVPLTRSGQTLLPPPETEEMEAAPHHPRAKLPERRKADAIPAEAGIAESAALEEAPALPKAVIPQKRAVEDIRAGEQPAAGRPRKQGGHLPAQRHESPAPGEPVSKPEPIPARGDVDMQAPVRKSTLPPIKAIPSPVPKKPDSPVPDAATQPSASEEADSKDKRFRLGIARQATFSPLHEADLSAETTGQWGDDTPAEHAPSFRRTYSLAVILFVLGVLGIGGFFLKKHFNPDDVKSNPTGLSTAVEEDLKRTHAIRAVVDRFFAADTVEALTAASYQRPGTSARIANYYRNQPITPRQVAISDNMADPIKLEENSYVLCNVKLDGYLNRKVAVFLTKSGDAAVDWDYYTYWAEIPWSDFLKTGSEKSGEYRVRLDPDTSKAYYNFAYADQLKWLCYELIDPQKEQKCFGYCTPEDAAFPKINAAIRRAREATGQEQTDVILRIKFEPEGQKNNQVRILDLVQEGWVQP